MNVRAITSPLCLLVVAACGHDHHAAGHDDHGAEPPELPGQAVTLWAAHHELFMEYRPLIVGHESSFAAHVTALPTFAAATAGSVEVAVVRGGARLVGKVDAAASPGIFRPTLTPDAAGACTITVTITTAAGSDTIDAGPCTIFADDAAARAGLADEPEPAGLIVFLKEQQWKTAFAMTEVAPRSMHPVVVASGEIRPVAGHAVEVTAPASGRVVVAESSPSLGDAVVAGQLLASIAPRATAGADGGALAAEVAAARAELDAATSEDQRAERLLAEQAIPTRQRDEARTQLRLAQARLDASRARQTQFSASARGSGRGIVQLRSPLDGVVVTTDVTPGQQLAEGDRLYTVMDLRRVWLVAHVYEADVARVGGAVGATFTLDGHPAPFAIAPPDGRVVTLGHVVDAATRTVPLVFELANPDGQLRVGNLARVEIQAGPATPALAVPTSAVIDDGGRPIVYVQAHGEAFTRRAVTLGNRAADWVEVRDGVALGEHVVSTGAYEVKLAASSGAVPAHGHAH